MSNYTVSFLHYTFVEEGKPMNPEKNPGSNARAINKFNPHTCAVQGQNGTKATWKEGDER